MKRELALLLLFAVCGTLQLPAFEASAPSVEQTTEPRIPVVTEVRAAECVSVSDGDTIKVRTDEGVVTVRLEGIDAPEARQDHSAKATKALHALVHGKDVEVHGTGTDQYDRTLAIVKVGDVNVNERLLADGWCWQYDEYNTDPAWTALEEEAREWRRGLWAHDNLVPPWEFRKLERQRRQAARDQQNRTAKPKTAAATTEAAPAPSDEDDSSLGYWLNSSSNVRHNSGCRYYKNTKRGRACSKSGYCPSLVLIRLARN